MSAPYLGEIRIFGGTFAPVGWHMCDGTLLNIADYSPLYALIGAVYGGNGSTTFALPDFRGRVPVGMGTGTGLTARQLGQSGGADQVALSEAQLPMHSHQLQAVTATAELPAPAPNATFGQLPANSQFYGVVPASPVTAACSAQSIAAAGGNQPHPNLMPYQTFNFIICCDGGIFPQRN